MELTYCSDVFSRPNSYIYAVLATAISAECIDVIELIDQRFTLPKGISFQICKRRALLGFKISIMTVVFILKHW